MNERISTRKLARLCLLAVLLTAVPILLSLWLSPKDSTAEAYLSLCSWDCVWYESIAQTGYHSPLPPVRQSPSVSNVAFFPGYPLLARAIVLALGLSDSRVPLLLVAQLAACFFWLALLLVLDRWKVRAAIQALVLTVVFTHPAAFYLILGYSESLFLASMLFYFYWADAPGKRTRWLAPVAGFAMTATRIVGVPVALYPVFRWLASQRDFRRIEWRGALQPIAIAGLSSLGCLLFLAYCEFQFGDFGLYMLTQKIGWGIAPDYGAIWKWDSFRYISSYERASTLASGIGLSVVLLAELSGALLTRSRPSPVRVPLYACAALIFYITLCGLESLWFRSMIRYTLPWWLLVALCLADVLSRRPRVSNQAIGAAIGLFLLFGYWVELSYLLVSLSGTWFA